MLKVAVIGLGNIGNLHARYYKENADAELVAVCDLQQERADKAAALHGVKAYYSIEELLNGEEIDAVSVCTSGADNGGDHYSPTMQVLEAGKHTLTEKPISNNIEHAREMVAKAREKNVQFGINLNHRFTPAAERLKKFQQDGALGEVLFINMALWINNGREDSPYFHVRALHPHSIDVMRFFGGDIARVQCFLHKGPEREIWSNMSLNVQFTSGAVGHLTGSYDASMFHPIERCEVGGSNGRGIIENVYERLEFLPRESGEKTVIDNGIMGGMASFNDTFKNRIFKFIEQINSGEPLEASGAEGLAAQEVIEAAIRSFENGTVEEVPPVAY
jgi:UDP-N-acetylglucosamine 3-dehydrogenase